MRYCHPPTTSLQSSSILNNSEPFSLRLYIYIYNLTALKASRLLKRSQEALQLWRHASPSTRLFWYSLPDRNAEMAAFSKGRLERRSRWQKFVEEVSSVRNFELHRHLKLLETEKKKKNFSFLPYMHWRVPQQSSDEQEVPKIPPICLWHWRHDNLVCTSHSSTSCKVLCLVLSVS